MEKSLSRIVVAVALVGGCLLSSGCSEDKKLQGAQAESSVEAEQAERGEMKLAEVPSSAASAQDGDFVYVNNGSEVQINGYQGDGGYIVIPDEIEGSAVTRIAPNAFADADGITGVSLPEKLQIIGDSAFYGIEGLTGVLVVPESVIDIGSHAFQSTSLTGIAIKSSCEIDVNAFANIRNLEFVYVAEGCSPEIGVSCFSHAESLTSILLPDTVTDIADETFSACNSATIYAPEGSYAESYANKSFIWVDTESYEEQAKAYSERY